MRKILLFNILLSIGVAQFNPYDLNNYTVQRDSVGIPLAAKAMFKSLLIPVMIVVAVSTWYTYNAILGYGTEFRPSKEVVYHSHLADKEGG